MPKKMKQQKSLKILQKLTESYLIKTKERNMTLANPISMGTLMVTMNK